MTKKELINIKGGFSLTATLINAFSRFGSLFFEVGQALGSAIRRHKDGSYCTY